MAVFCFAQIDILFNNPNTYYIFETRMDQMIFINCSMPYKTNKLTDFQYIIIVYWLF